MEVCLDSKIGVSDAVGRPVSCGSIDREIGNVHIQFQVVWKTIVEFEVCGILAQVGYLKLKSVIFIEELEVPLSALGDPGVIGIKRQLTVQRLADAEDTEQQQQSTHMETH